MYYDDTYKTVTDGLPDGCSIRIYNGNYPRNFKLFVGDTIVAGGYEWCENSSKEWVIVYPITSNTNWLDMVMNNFRKFQEEKRKQQQDKYLQEQEQKQEQKRLKADNAINTLLSR